MTGDPGVSSSRLDAGLVTWQVHGHAMLRRCHRPALRCHSTGPPRPHRPPRSLASRTPPPERTRVCHFAEVEFADVHLLTQPHPSLARGRSDLRRDPGVQHAASDRDQLDESAAASLPIPGTAPSLASSRSVSAAPTRSTSRPVVGSSGSAKSTSAILAVRSSWAWAAMLSMSVPSITGKLRVAIT